MKLILMILVIVSIVSCGKDNSSSHGSDNSREEQEDIPGRNGYLDANNVGETELLNVTGKVSMTLSGDRIVINSPLALKDTGSRTSCSISIKAGEIWHFRMGNNGMELELPDGTRQLLKAIGNGSEVIGSWIWTGNNGGTKLRRRYSFLSNTLIINQDCEQ